MGTPEGFDYDRIKTACREILLAIGENPDREGLADTPRRFADFWKEFIQYDPGNCDTNFEVVEADQMVVVSGIRVWSLCEHHLLPFSCEIKMGYITRSKVIGLSKFGRLAHLFAHRLQLQERLVTQIADEIIALAGHDDVAVIGEGEHLCMSMRGIKTPARMVSSSLHGVFKTNPDARKEFLTLGN